MKIGEQNKEKLKRRVKIIFGILVSITFVLLIFLLTTTSISIFLNKKHMTEMKSSSHHDFYPSETTFIKKPPYVKNEKKHTLLFDNFGSNQYVCKGTCCNKKKNDQKRRNAAGLLPQGMIKYFIVALTSISAYHIAKKQIEDDCKKDDEYKDDLPDCDPWDYDDHHIECEEFYVPETLEEMKGLRRGKKIPYFCGGKCLPMDFKVEKTRPELDWKKFVGKDIKSFEGEERNEFFGHIQYMANNICNKNGMHKQLRIDFMPEVEPKNQLKYARKFFVWQHLDPFCRMYGPNYDLSEEDQSMSDTFAFEEQDEAELKGVKMVDTYCIGTEDKLEMENPTVYCYVLMPEDFKGEDFNDDDEDWGPDYK